RRGCSGVRPASRSPAGGRSIRPPELAILVLTSWVLQWLRSDRGTRPVRRLLVELEVHLFFQEVDEVPGLGFLEPLPVAVRPPCAVDHDLAFAEADEHPAPGGREDPGLQPAGLHAPGLREIEPSGTSD